MRNEYKREMEQLEPRPEELEQLYEMIEGGDLMNRKQRLGRQAVIAIAACTLLTITAAAAAIPTVWETLQEQLGSFAPYTQTIEEAECQDQGIKIQVLSALSDDLETKVYFSVQDVESDRLNEFLTLEGWLAVETMRDVEETEETGGSGFLALSIPSTSRNSRFKLHSYDPETKTALFSVQVGYYKNVRPGQTAQLSLTGMTTKEAVINGTAPCASITGETLESLPVNPSNQMIFSSGDGVNFPYTNAVLPSEAVVLAPGQTPVPIEGNDDIWISSMGFASDGRFHVRLGFAEGVSVCDEDGDSWFLCTLEQTGKSMDEEMAIWERLVPGGVDIIFPLYTAEDLEQLQNGTLEFYGNYTRPGLDIEGSWSIEFALEHYASTVLDWTGELAGRQVRQVTVSPLSVTMYSSDTGQFATTTLYATKKDGTTVAAEPGTGGYSNIGLDTGTTVWDAYNTWQFEEPVDIEELVSLTLLDETIPLR